MASKEFAINNCDDWRILSALHGLVHPDTDLNPYNKVMSDHDLSERLEWIDKVLAELKSKYQPGTIITFLAGAKYAKPLSQPLLQYGYRLANPLKGQGIGKRVQWLNNANKSNACLKHLDQLYGMLDRVIDFNGGTIMTLDQYLSERYSFKRGIYFFYDPNESRTTLLNQPRIVRVGTHAVSKGSKSTIRNRLKQHRGTFNGLGNHRGSIFRGHVGRAILNQNPNERIVSTWMKEQSASKQIRDAEAELERQVSEYIRRLYVVGVEVDDDPGRTSDRAYIERNAIGLLSKAAKHFDAPTNKWLGQFTEHAVIRDSGLWNVEHIGFSYDERFLTILETYVNSTVGDSPKPSHSIAPLGWHEARST